MADRPTSEPPTDSAARARSPRVIALSWDDPFIRGSVGIMLVIGAAIAVLASLPNLEPGANSFGFWAVAGLSISAGIAILALRRTEIALSFETVAIAATVLITAAIWYSRDPTTPLVLLYLWPTVLVYSFFPRFDIVAHTLAVLGCSAAVITAIIIDQPELGPITDHIGRWLLLAATLVMVGCVARALTASVSRSEQRLRRGFEDSPMGIALVSTDYHWIDMNEAVATMLGRSRDELIGRPTAEVTHPDDVEISRGAVGEMNDGRARVEFEKRYLRPDGTPVSALVTARLVTGTRGEQFFYSVVNDLTGQRSAEEQLLFEATHDALTGLPNRASAMRTLENMLFEASALGGTVTVIISDLDDFKVINDSLGHIVGDQALREVANRMTEGLGSWGAIARLGGDEFIFVGRNVGEMSADLGERLLKLVSEPLKIDGLTHHLTASVGIATSTADSVPEDMLRDADTAMYRAKSLGKGAFEVFDDDCRANAVERLNVEQELRRELESPTGALCAYYQPILRLEDLTIVGFEALVRWRRADELISPARFVPIAEDSGLIVELGRYVLADAVTTFTSLLERRPDTKGLHLHVNVSARQVASDSLLDDIETVIAMTNLPFGALTIEVTETALLDERRAARFCQRLRHTGVRVGLDDFGTGYSALSHLRRLDLDVLKVDRSFVSGLGVGGRDQAIVRSTIELAHAVGLPVVAEGIETEAQLETLRSIGCDYAQGFLFARPVPASRLDEVLAKFQPRPILDAAI